MESPSSTDLERLRKGLGEPAHALVECPGFRPSAVFARSERGDLLGGAAGAVNWNWLDLSLLWVDETLRGTGLARVC